MPLRMRLIVLVGAMLLASLAGGSALVAWHAAGRVRTELQAALSVGTKTVRNGYDDLARSTDRAADLRRLVSTFNGNRHVRATWLDERDQPVAASQLFVPTEPTPRWFHSLIGSNPGVVRLLVPRDSTIGGTVVLQADPTNEVGEVWGESRDFVLVLGGFALLSAVLICLAVGRALRPLDAVSLAFDRIAQGDYQGAVPEHGPPELARLSRGFNVMTRHLAAAAAQNRRLNERLLTLQAEERADLARDLHDEIGPMLFAVNMTAATIERLAESGHGTDIPEQVRSIHDAISRMQRHVRAILERLRPMQSIGLEVAIDRLVAFWKNRRPNVTFGVVISVETDCFGDDVKETIYRVIQEGVSNAIRHGEPARVMIAVASDADDGIRVEVTDDGIGLPSNGVVEPASRQFGLLGMRERLVAMAGSLSIQPGADNHGLTLVARLPYAATPGISTEVTAT
ncbi:MAG TPA: histidine kinase [Acetobacteraceae bacterium]|jgi:two-component system sensor histidine kinase UhpB|nr:histidine kinase [Acetobacteraceae bacterium]